MTADQGSVVERSVASKAALVAEAGYKIKNPRSLLRGLLI